MQTGARLQSTHWHKMPGALWSHSMVAIAIATKTPPHDYNCIVCALCVRAMIPVGNTLSLRATAKDTCVYKPSSSSSSPLFPPSPLLFPPPSFSSFFLPFLSVSLAFPLLLSFPPSPNATNTKKVMIFRCCVVDPDSNKETRLKLGDAIFGARIWHKQLRVRCAWCGFSGFELWCFQGTRNSVYSNYYHYYHTDNWFIHCILV